MGMTTPHICMTCRRRLSQLRPPNAVQWRPRATFISLSSNKPPTSKDTTPRGESFKAEPGPATATATAAVDESVPRGKTPLIRPKNATPGDVLESLFEQTIRSQSAPDEEFMMSEYESKKLRIYKNAQVLKDMVASPQPLQDTWAFFLEHFGPEALKAQNLRITGTKIERSPAFLHAVASSLLSKLIRAKRENPLSESLPSVTELSRVYFQRGQLRAPEWGNLVSIILQALLTSEKQQLKDPGTEVRLLKDLLGAWHVVCRDFYQFDKFPAMESAAVYWSTLPPLAVKGGRRFDPNRPFASLVIAFPGTRNFTLLPLLALASFGLLSKSSTREMLPIDISPLLIRFSVAVDHPELDVKQYCKMAPKANLLIADYVDENWPSIKERASEMTVLANATDGKITKNRLSDLRNLDSTRSLSVPQTKISLIRRRLFHALKSRDTRYVDDLWSDVVKWPVEPDSQKSLERATGVFTPRLANHFILIFMSLRQPNRAIDVWNHMIENGIAPNEHTWNAMLEGCKAARDGKAVEQIWYQMIATGFVPNEFLWTARISALIACQQVDTAIAALDEMGRLWTKAARLKYPTMPLSQLQLVTDVDGPAKPGINAINCAVDNLLKKQMAAAAYKVLAWGGKFGIVPNVVTYNALLRPLITGGHTKESMLLLKRMKQAGIEANAYTFTAIIDEALRDLRGLSPEETLEIIKSIFDEMLSAGIVPDRPTYGKIIQHLLFGNEEGNGASDMAIVNAVMAYMTKENVEPNAQIFTMLLEWHFAQPSPNLAAVRSIIDMATSVLGGTDAIFWDRAIEGYAVAGETGPALRILERVQNGREKAGWRSLKALLSALVANQEMEFAKRLVDDAVMDNGGPVPMESHGLDRQYSWQFWKLARDLGFVESGPHLKAAYEERVLAEEEKKAED